MLRISQALLRHAQESKTLNRIYFEKTRLCSFFSSHEPNQSSKLNILSSRCALQDLFRPDIFGPLMPPFLVSRIRASVCCYVISLLLPSFEMDIKNAHLQTNTLSSKYRYRTQSTYILHPHCKYLPILVSDYEQRQ